MDPPRNLINAGIFVAPNRTALPILFADSPLAKRPLLLLPLTHKSISSSSKPSSQGFEILVATALRVPALLCTLTHFRSKAKPSIGRFLRLASDLPKSSGGRVHSFCASKPRHPHVVKLLIFRIECVGRFTLKPVNLTRSGCIMVGIPSIRMPERNIWMKHGFASTKCGRALPDGQ